jgi:Gnt-I system high-affinity gluconate transporter
MPLLIVGIGIVILLLLISKFKINAFLALLITCFAVGLLSRMNPMDILDSVLKGVGDTMGKIVLILAFGAMLGKILEESGAAHTITFRMIDFMGLKNIQYALLITGFLVGLPMMYNASFLVLIPLIFTFAATTKLPTIWLALPLCSALSVAHCFLPPHPAPTYVSFIYEADVNKVLLYGLIPMIPACLIGGVWLSRFTKNIQVTPPADLFQERKFEKSELPGLGISILCAVTPIILMLLGALTDLSFGPPPAKTELTQLGIENITGFYQYIFTEKGFNPQATNIISGVLTFFKFMSDANIALFMAVIVAIFTLGLRKGV